MNLRLFYFHVTIWAAQENREKVFPHAQCSNLCNEKCRSEQELESMEKYSTKNIWDQTQA